MKVLISDYIDRMMPDHEPEVQTLQAGLGDNVEVDIWPYTDEKRDEFYARLHDADALLTAFIPIDAEAFDHAPSLKVIAIDATGYDNVDLDEATKTIQIMGIEGTYAVDGEKLTLTAEDGSIYEGTIKDGTITIKIYSDVGAVQFVIDD